MNKNQGKRTTKVGIVIANKMKKTVTVNVERQIRHPLYKKIVKKKKNYFAHDEYEKCKIGDLVRIVETRPLSKTKRWSVEGIVGLSPSEREKEIEEKKK